MMDPVKASSDQTEMQRLCYSPTSPQDELNAALRAHNSELFARALQLGADPDRVYPDGGDDKLSVFEVCCQRPGHGEFVRLCVRHGAQVNKVSGWKRVTLKNPKLKSKIIDDTAI